MKTVIKQCADCKLKKTCDILPQLSAAMGAWDTQLIANNFFGVDIIRANETKLIDDNYLFVDIECEFKPKNEKKSFTR